MPEFRCDLSARGTPLQHFWEECVGSGNATLSLRADYQEQLKRCHHELGFKRIRFHGWFLDQLSVVLSDGHFSFLNLDKIVDALAGIGMSPFVETSFMPEAFASGKKRVFSYRGNVTPPRDYRRWSALIGELVKHWSRRYQMRKWMFEVWNEPNLPSFWASTQQHYFKLYRHTVEAIKKQDASLRVGGPASAQNKWIEEFLNFCAKNKLPVDFVSTHQYPNDPPYETLPPPRSILREWAQDARCRTRGLPLFYTEWNTSFDQRDLGHDQPYAAAFVVKTIIEAAGLVAGYSFWTFSDIFAEKEMPSTPFHGGFGLLTLHGIPKPTYRAFELLHDLGTEFLLVDGMHPQIDAWVIRKSKSVTILLTNLDPVNAMPVNVTLQNAVRRTSAIVRRIDEEHANPYRAWREIGKPEYLTTSQLDKLEEASRLRSEKILLRPRGKDVQFQLKLPASAVAAITI